jgi:hypothetical protein
MLADDSNRNIIQAVSLTPNTYTGTPTALAVKPGKYQTITILDAGTVTVGFTDSADLSFTTTGPMAFTLDKTVDSITCTVAVLLS